jgi:hypothetical protein
LRYPPTSAALLALALSGCFPPDDGTSPPSNRIYYPVGAALSVGGTRLYLANSNFDLQFNAGTLQALDAVAIRERLPRPCVSDADCPGNLRCEALGLCVDGSGDPCQGLPEPAPSERVQSPALCGPLALEEVLLESVDIAPFVTDLKYTLFTDERGTERARLLLPVRGDATLHWADVEHDVASRGPVLDCGQGGGTSCDDDHRRGDRADEGQLPDERVPTEPFSLAVSADGRAVVVAHQQRGIVSLFHNGDDGPELQDVLDGLPLNPMGLAAVPPPALARVSDIDYEPGFLVSYRHSSDRAPTVELLRYFDARRAAPGSPFLQRASSSAITVASSGLDSRGVVIDDRERAACEASCEAECGNPWPEPATASAECVACAEGCATVALSAYMVNRSPEALLIGETRSILGETFRDDVPVFSDTEPLRGGPSRVYAADVIDVDGEPARRIFVLAFDSRLLYIFNPENRTIEKRVTTGRGPHALAVALGLGYVAHFTDSYVGVLDLDKRHATYGEFLLNVGRPTPPRSAR